MLKRVYFLLGAVATLVVIAVAVAYPRVNHVSANTTTTSIERPDAGQSDSISNSMDARVSSANSRVNMQQQTVETADREAQAVSKLLILTDKANRSLINPGWLYIKESGEGDGDLSGRGSLPNGQDIPINYTSEIWYHFDDQLRVIEFVSIQRDANGQAVQIGVHSNGTSWNSATGETSALEPFVLSTLDYGFAEQATAFAASSQVDEMAVVLNGKPALLFSSLESYPEPLLMAEANQSVVANEGRAYLDPETGQLLQHEIIAHLSDGTQRVVSRVVLEFKPNVIPTAEVLELLASRKPSQ